MPTPESIQPENTDSAILEDIYVPGLGVRAALAEDDDSNDQKCWRGLRERWRARASYLARARVETFCRVRHAAAPISIRLKEIPHDCRAAMAKGFIRSAQLANSTHRHFRQTQTHLVELTRLRASHLQNVKYHFSLWAWMARAITPFRQQVRSAFFRAASETALQVYRTRVYREKVRQQIREIVSPELQRIYQFSQRAFRGIRNQGQRVARTIANTLAIRVPDSVALRRAAPVFAILLVMAVFVILDVITNARH
jgi:hypothetical protein